MTAELVTDGTIAQDSSQANGIWQLREGISVALRHAGVQARTKSELYEPSQLAKTVC